MREIIKTVVSIVLMAYVVDAPKVGKVYAYNIIAIYQRAAMSHLNQLIFDFSSRHLVSPD